VCRVLLGLVVSVYTFCFHNMVTYLHDCFRLILILRNTIVHCLILLIFTLILIIIIIIIGRRHNVHHQRCLLRYVALKRWIHRIIPPIEKSINKITIYIERWVEPKNWFSTLLVKERVDNKSKKSRLIISKKRNIAKQSKVF
jgi:hypothetical protein